MNTNDEVERRLKHLQLLQRREQLKRELPHVHGFKLYNWQREFIETTNPVAVLCAGNQIGKSSANYLRMIRLATSPDLWPKYFPIRRPLQFWFLQPTRDIMTTEYRTKLVPEFLPKGEFKNHPQYGWEEEMRNKHVWALHFKTGVSIYMHTYEQDVHHLQAGTVDAMFVDEEPPWELMPELMMRLQAVQGSFSASMTPTRGQDQWRRVFEVKGEGELFQGAFKKRVSVFDCTEYEDGTPSRWTLERINQMINTLGTQQEIDLRIYGKFVAQEGLRVPAFDRTRNVIPSSQFPAGDELLWYSGVDIGSGGQAHPPAIVFVAVHPTYQKAYVPLVWKGDPRKNYTVSDIIDKYMELRGSRTMSGQYYDFASAEFGIVATRTGLGFEKAEKGHDIGFPLMNTLFKNKMIDIVDNEGTQQLVNELVTVRHESAKNKTGDDALDAFRYAISKIAWNFEGITGEKIIQTKRKNPTNDDLRRGFVEEKEDIWSPGEEIREWNELMEPEYDW